MEKEEYFNQLVKENLDRLNRISRFYISNPEDRKDLFQEILTNIWKSLDNFKDKSSIETYIYRVAVNTALNFRGKVQRKFNVSLDPENIHLASFQEDLGKLEKQKTEEQLQWLENQLNLLSIIDRTLISLMLEGMSSKQIADVIGITEPNVKTKLHRIKQKLKDSSPKI